MLACNDGTFIEVFSGSSAEKLPEGAFIHLALRVDDCDAAYNAAIAAGCTCQAEPKTTTVPARPQPFTVRIAFVYGLDGEVLEFMQEL